MWNFIWSVYALYVPPPTYVSLSSVDPSYVLPLYVPCMSLLCTYVLLPCVPCVIVCSFSIFSSVCPSVCLSYIPPLYVPLPCIPCMFLLYIFLIYPSVCPSACPSVCPSFVYPLHILPLYISPYVCPYVSSVELYFCMLLNHPLSMCVQLFVFCFFVLIVWCISFNYQAL